MILLISSQTFAILYKSAPYADHSKVSILLDFKRLYVDPGLWVA